MTNVKLPQHINCAGLLLKPWNLRSAFPGLAESMMDPKTNGPWGPFCNAQRAKFGTGQFKRMAKGGDTKREDLKMPLATRERPETLSILGACTMTTNFSTIKFAISKFYCRDVSHEKKNTAFWTIFLSAPQCPSPQKPKFYFYCRLAISEFHSVLNQDFSGHPISVLWGERWPRTLVIRITAITLACDSAITIT